MLDHANPRLAKNNFDLLRLLFAATVCLVHAYVLSGFQQLGIIANVLSSAVAVKSFFVVSGFLIFMSFEHSSSFAAYARKRIRRIYPALFHGDHALRVGLVAVSSKNITEYFSFAWVKYVAANLAFLNFWQPTLPGVFDSNMLPDVNGALWTLKIEIMFYLAVPLFVFLFRRFSPPSGSRDCLLHLYRLCNAAGVGRRTHRLCRLCRTRTPVTRTAFLFHDGALFYYFLPYFERRVGYFLAAAALVLTANHALPLALLEPLALGTVVIFFGLFLYVGNLENMVTFPMVSTYCISPSSSFSCIWVA